LDLGLLIPIAFVAFIIAGAVKGLAGMGLPTTAIALLTLIVDPRTAIAVVLLPMLATNGWQVWRMGNVRAALWRYRWFAGLLMIGVWVTTQFAAEASDRLIFGVTGGVIIVFVVVNLRQKLPKLPDRLDTATQIGFGTIAGVLGGLTAIWAPPMAIYLAARDTEKDEFVRATGLLIFLGSVPLFFGYLSENLLTGQLATVSAIMIVPAMAGFTIGERLRRNLDQNQFRRILLYVFLVLGLNLIRRAIWNV
jgi:uncharacterized membrane protein YfcA